MAYCCKAPWVKQDLCNIQRAGNRFCVTYAGGPDDRARMDLLRQCCSMYEGNHPFHNYTKRRLYRTSETQSATGE